MGKVSLYRKYRPATFSEMIGQEHIVHTLKNQILRGEISHAYIFTGTRGTGKTSTAKILARAVNCLQPLNDGSPCGECDVCKATSKGVDFDTLEIDAASNNGVNEIRDICEKVNYAPSVGKYRTYIIDEVHSLSSSAFNALLKTLEEPPSHIIFILATTDIHKVPATILSRCIRFDFRLLSVKELTQHLKNIFDKEGRKYEIQALSAIAEAGEGSVRDALSIADTCASYCDDVITHAEVLEVLGGNSPSLIVDLASAIMRGEPTTMLSILGRLLSLGKSPAVLTRDIVKYLRALLYIKNCYEAKSILELPREIELALIEIAKISNNDKLVRAIEGFTRLEGEMRYSANSSVLLEAAAIKACEDRANFDNTTLVARINDVEKAIKSGVVSETVKQGISQDVSVSTDIKVIWGRVVNILFKRGSFVAYTCAQDIPMSSMSVKNDCVEISVDSSDLYKAYGNYVQEFESIAKENFSNIKSIILVKNYKEIEDKNNSVEKLKDYFGDDKVVMKED